MFSVNILQMTFISCEQNRNDIHDGVSRHVNTSMMIYFMLCLLELTQ